MGERIYFLEKFDIISNNINPKFVIKELNKDSIKEVETIFVKLAYRLDQEFLSKFNNLKYIVSPTTGITHIDTNYTEKKGIKIISLKGEEKFLADVPSTAEMTLLFILAISRNLNRAKAIVECGEWRRNSIPGFNLRDLRILIVGYGRVGKQVERILTFFGAEIYIFDPAIKSNNRKV